MAAAREARRRGASAVLVNRGPLGGDCTFTGCVPSKTVIESARAGASFAEAFERARSVVARVAASENAEVLRSEGVEVIDDEGTVTGPGRLRVGETEFRARGLVLALGSRPSLPPVPGLQEADPLTSETLWDLGSAPASMAVIGAGAIGCELSQALTGLGVAVTLIEIAPRLLAGEEEAASAIIAGSLAEDGVDVRLDVGVVEVVATTAGHRLALTDGSSIEVERILVAAGRAPNSDRGGVLEVGLRLTERGYVATEDDLSTNLARTWAVGDITGRVQLTHAADHMGRLATANALRRVMRSRFRAHEIPRVTYTAPEVAAVGLSEAEAAARWGNAMVAELPLDAHDRALAAGATDGYIKLIAGPKPVVGTLGGGRLVGASVVAERAGELIAELTLALKLRTFLGRLALTVHPYPSWSYAIPKTAAQFFTTVEGRSARPARTT